MRSGETGVRTVGTVDDFTEYKEADFLNILNVIATLINEAQQFTQKVMDLDIERDRDSYTRRS